MEEEEPCNLETNRNGGIELELYFTSKYNLE